MKGVMRELSVVLVLLVLLAALAIFAPAFFRPAQFTSWLSGVAPVLLVSTAMAFVIIGRQIDISVGSQFAWCSIVTGLAVRAGWPIPAAAAAGVATGALLGATNGFLVAVVGLPSIVVTLSTMVTSREALRWWREGEFVRDLPDHFQWFGLGQEKGQWLLIGAVFLIWGGLAWGTRNIAGFRWIYASGSDEEAARLAGIRPRNVRFVLFTGMGAITGLAAVLNAVRFTDVDPKTGTGLELQAIASAVVGGVAISGGRGRLWGVLAGAVLLACIAPALVFMKWPPQWEKAVQGAIILLAAAADGWRQTTSGRASRTSPKP